MALRVSQACRAARRIVGLLVLLGALVAIANLAGDPVAWAHGDTFLVSTLLYLVAPISIARHLLLRHQIDQQTILGTIAI